QKVAQGAQLVGAARALDHMAGDRRALLGREDVKLIVAQPLRRRAVEALERDLESALHPGVFPGRGHAVRAGPQMFDNAWRSFAVDVGEHLLWRNRAGVRIIHGASGPPFHQTKRTPDRFSRIAPRIARDKDASLRAS